MYLRGMKTLFKFLLILLFPICVNGQITTFHSAENHPLLSCYSDSVVSCESDSFRHNLLLFPRLLLIRNSNKAENTLTYLYGISLNLKLTQKLSFSGKFDVLSENHNSLINEYQDSLFVFPGFGREKSRLQYNLKYYLNKFITADFGKGNHFIGNGYRSLLLSAEHSSYPYLKLTTEFGRVRYYNLYTTFLDIQNPTQNRKKHASIHFLDFQLTDNLNIGVFEGVLWQAKDENYNRGYDVEYLNPIIFFRPVEFSKHSPDNVLMGATFNATFKAATFYSQILLDDLNISRQKDRDDSFSGGFFQNKFAYQLGVKSTIKGVNVLLEYNQAQPYTYAHKEAMQSYTHMNQALAHPLGANFKEVVVLGDYSQGKWKLSAKLTFSKVGLDSTHTHYGQNIFYSDFDAVNEGSLHSYGNFNGQGVSTQINTLYTEVAYSLGWFDVFGSVFYKKKKSDLVGQTSVFYSLGIRTFPFSTFQDY